MITVLGYICGLLMGVVLGTLGAGGSILTVPILIYLLKVPAVEATGVSLLVVGVTASVTCFGYFRSGWLSFRHALLFVIPGMIGVNLTRNWLIPRLPDIIFKGDLFALSKSDMILFSFAIIMILASVSMIRQKGLKSKPAHHLDARAILKIGVVGFFIGLISGVVGAGGGFLIIPSLVLLVGLEMKMAVGTSLFIIACNSISAVAGQIISGVSFRWQMSLALCILAILGSFLGHKVSSKIPTQSLKVIFGYFVLVMGAIIILKELSMR